LLEIFLSSNFGQSSSTTIDNKFTWLFGTIILDFQVLQSNKRSYSKT
jgi:hypothetical protein